MKVNCKTKRKYLWASLFLQMLSGSFLSAHASPEPKEQTKDSDLQPIKGNFSNSGDHLTYQGTSEMDEVDRLMVKLCNKSALLAQLDKLTIEELWDCFLKNQ